MIGGEGAEIHRRLGIGGEHHEDVVRCEILESHLGHHEGQRADQAAGVENALHTMPSVMPVAAAVILAAVVLAGCGSPSADLFEVKRTGRDTNANVTLLVSDGGTVNCNGGKALPIDADRLLDARELARDLEPQAALGLQLEAQDSSTLRYVVRTGAGTLEFSDTSAGRTKQMNRVVAFTTAITEQVCKLER